MEDADGFVFFGVRACGGGFCQILEDVQIRDFNGGVLDPSNDFILTSNYSIEVRRADAADCKRAARESGSSTNDRGESMEQELLRLRRELAEVKKDRGAPVKSIAVFVKERK